MVSHQTLRFFLSVIAKLFFFIISHLVLKGPEEPPEFQRQVIQRILGLKEPKGDEVLLWGERRDTSVSPCFIFPLTS